MNRQPESSTTRLLGFLVLIVALSVGSPARVRSQAVITGTLRQLTTHPASQWSTVVS
jgi:hypothetical protein